VTSAGAWTFSTVAVSGNYAILLNGKAAGGSAVTMLVYNQGKLYVENKASKWYLWNGTGWSAVGIDPRTPASPDGTVLNAPSAGSLLTGAGTWTFNSAAVSGNYAILLNGKSAAGGYAVTMLVYNQGKLYVENSASKWYLWNGSGWNAVSADPRGVQRSEAF
jgi:hypothetical protein